MNIFEKEKIITFKDAQSGKGAICTIQTSTGSSTSAFVVSVQGEGGVAIQVDQAMDRTVYYTVFGDRIANFSFKAIEFPEYLKCSGAESFMKVSNFWKNCRASAGSTPTVVTMAMLGTVFKGLLHNVVLLPYNAGNNPNDANTVLYEFRFTGKIEL